MRLPPGKVPRKTLERVVYKCLGEDHSEILVGPSYGIDGAVIRIDNAILVTSMDPITGALERIGWTAINVNANDVATFGVQPSYFSSCLLLPEYYTEREVEIICTQIHSGAKKLEIAVTGGHSERTPKLNFPIVVGCCFGVGAKGNYVTSAGAKPGNKLILSKTLGIEGTAILATDRHARLEGKIENSLLKEAQGLFNSISIVNEAMVAFMTGFVTAMHDPTEGGVAGGIHELADASNVGFEVYEDKMKIAEATTRICKFFQIDPLQLIASGSLLISVDGNFADEVVKAINKIHVSATVIGEILPSPRERKIMRVEGHTESLVRPTSDHLWKALASEDL